MQFALVNRCLLVRVEELNRIFDRYDVDRLLVVDLVDDRGKCRRLSRTGWTCYQHDAVLELRNVRKLRREPIRIKVWNVGGNHAHNDGATAALRKNIHAKPGDSR